MGLCASSERPPSPLQLRTQLAIQRLRQHSEGKPGSSGPRTLTRIVLQFPKVKKSFRAVRKVWRDFDTDGNGTLEYGELTACLDALGADVTPEDARDMFEEADIDGSQGLDFREFIVALALGCVLHLAPSMEIYAGASVAPAAAASGPGAPDTVTSNPMSSASAVKQPTRMSRAKSYVRSKQMEGIVAAMRICLETFMLFDDNGDGVLEKAEVMHQLREKSKNARRHSGVGFGAASFLSQDRWEGMAWDRRGTITFREFCVSFYDWICPDGDVSGMEDDEDDEDDAPRSPLEAALLPAPPGGPVPPARSSSDDGSLGDADLQDVAVIATGTPPVPPPTPPVPPPTPPP